MEIGLSTITKNQSHRLKEGYYINSHSLKPYTQYSKEINKLINLILK